MLLGLNSYSRLCFRHIQIYSSNIQGHTYACNWTRIQNHLVRKRTLNHLAKLAFNDWAAFWVLICTVHLTVFVHELSDSGFESSCSHLNFRFRACFEQGVPWHSGNFRVWIHSETRTCHDKHIQSYLSIFRTMCIRGIFRILAYFYHNSYSESQGISIILYWTFALKPHLGRLIQFWMGLYFIDVI